MVDRAIRGMTVMLAGRFQFLTERDFIGAVQLNRTTLYNVKRRAVMFYPSSFVLNLVGWISPQIDLGRWRLV